MTNAESRREFYERLDRAGFAPLWEVLGNLVTPEPRPATRPALWKYAEIRPLLMEAGGLITAEEAERRVLVLENPGLRGKSQVTGSLYAGAQLLLPGEVARSHRHTATALRFVLESDDAYTAVNGARQKMAPGDFLVTPSWMFHDHGNPGLRPAVWLDGLDVPMVNLFDASFLERENARSEAEPPVFHFPYEISRRELEHMRRRGAPDPCQGYKNEYVNAWTGARPMFTIAAFLQLLPKGFNGATYRSTDATVYCCAEGGGKSRVGESLFEWGERDIFVVPSWAPVAHSVAVDTVLFSFSDRPAQEALGLWRERAD